MNVPILGDIIKEIGTTVREVIPDADKRLDVEVRLRELAAQADARETELLQDQIDVNKEEAKNSNLFVAGWRPAIGWVGAFSLGWTWMFAPLLQWTAQLLGHPTSIPALDPNAMYPVILAMLGVSASRTVEKLQGVATSMNGRVLANERPLASTNTSEAKGKISVVEQIQTSTSRWFK